MRHCRLFELLFMQEFGVGGGAWISSIHLHVNTHFDGGRIDRYCCVQRPVQIDKIIDTANIKIINKETRESTRKEPDNNNNNKKSK